MSQRLRLVLPFAVAVALVAFAWLELAFNFSFHWATAGDLGNGLELPSDFELVGPAAFISWGVFFAAGADGGAFTKAVGSSIVGAVGALVLMLAAPQLSGLPDFWAVTGLSAVLAVILVSASVTSEHYYTPGVIMSFAAVMFWWVATGLDGWAPDGGGVGNSLAALADPAKAGTGAFHGVLSTPVLWVFISSLVSLLCGCLMGPVTTRLAGLLSFAPAPNDSAAPAEVA